MSSSSLEDHRMMHRCVLDINFRSECLSRKIADLPKRLRIEISEGVNKNSEAAVREWILPSSLKLIQLDLKRDRLFIVSLAVSCHNIVKIFPEIQLEKQVALDILTPKNAIYWDIGINLCNYLKTNCGKHNLFSDKEFILDVFKESSNSNIKASLVSALSADLKRDPQVAKAVTSYSAISMQEFHESIKTNRELILEIVKSNCYVLKYSNRKFLDDFEILSTALNNYGFAANSYILDNVENLQFLKYWLAKYPYQYKYLSPRMQGHPELALNAIKERVINMRDIREEECITKDIILEALKINSNFVYYPTKFLKDKEIFIQAVKKSPDQLQYADESLRKDKEFIIDLIEINPLVVKYIHSTLDDDFEIAEIVVKRNGLLLQYFSPIIRGDVKVVLLAVRQNPNSVQFSTIQNMEIVIEVVQRNGTAIQFINPQFKEQKQVVLMAVKQNGHGLTFIDNCLRLDREIVMEALNNNCPFCKVDPALRSDKEIALVAIRNDARAVKLLDPSIRNDEDLKSTKEGHARCWVVNL